MSFELIAFYAFAAITTLSALAVVTVRNSVHAALLLVLTFFSAACIWLLAEAEFLGIVLVLVYVGAVMVLFLFVVMMLDIHTATERAGFTRYFPLAAVVAVIMALQMLALIGVQRFGETVESPDPALSTGVSNTEWIGQALFREYVLPFEIAAVILTVAIIAAIALTLRHRGGVKRQDPARQVRVKRDERLRIVKMKPTIRQEETP